MLFLPKLSSLRSLAASPRVDAARGFPSEAAGVWMGAAAAPMKITVASTPFDASFSSASSFCFHLFSALIVAPSVYLKTKKRRQNERRKFGESNFCDKRNRTSLQNMYSSCTYFFTIVLDLLSICCLQRRLYLDQVLLKIFIVTCAEAGERMNRAEADSHPHKPNYISVFSKIN